MAYYQNDFIRSQRVIFDEMLKASNKASDNKGSIENQKIEKTQLTTTNPKVENAVFSYINSLVDIDFQIQFTGGIFSSVIEQHIAIPDPQAKYKFLQNEGSKVLSSINNLNSLLVKTNLNFKSNLSKNVDSVSPADNEKIKEKLDIIQINFEQQIGMLDLNELIDLSFSVFPMIEQTDQYIVRLINNFNIYLNTSKTSSITPLTIDSFYDVAKKEQGVVLGGFLYSQRGGYMSGGTIYNDPNFRLNPMKRFS